MQEGAQRTGLTGGGSRVDAGKGVGGGEIA